MRKTAALLLLVLVLTCCQPAQVFLRPALEEEGEVYVYLQPVTRSEFLSFSMTSLSAVRSGGEEFPLSLSLAEFTAATTARQRLVAGGRLPPGSYTGLSLSIRRALVKTEEGDADLLVPKAPHPVPVSFTVSRKKATTVFLTFDPRGSLQGGISFAPLFFRYVPAKPPLSLTGLVTNSGSHTVLVFDKKAGQVVDVIATGGSPRGMALDRLLAKVYVALSGDDAVGVIDIASGAPFGTIRLSAGDRPREVALTPDGRTLLVANTGSGVVSFVDTTSLVEVGRIRVGNEPRSVLIDGSGRRAYVFNTGSSTISVLDIAGRSVAATFSTEGSPLRGQLNRRGDRLYVIHEWSPYLSIVDPRTLARTGRIYAGMGALSLRLDSATDFLYLSRKAERFVDVFSPLTGMPIDSIATTGWVGYMTIDGEQSVIYLAMPESGRVAAINTISKKLVYEIDTGDMPGWISVMGER